MNQSEREQTNGNRGRKESEYAWQVKRCDQQKKRLPRVMKADIRVTLPCPWVFDAADQGNGSC